MLGKLRILKCEKGHENGKWNPLTGILFNYINNEFSQMLMMGTSLMQTIH